MNRSTVDHTIHLLSCCRSARITPGIARCTLRFLCARTPRGGTLSVACYVSTNAGDCDCPRDNNNHAGVLINVFPGYQCAYPNGACTWDDKSGALQNTAQTNCPTSAPCPAAGCVCPTNNDGDSGVLINAFKGYQCAYPDGLCTWDGEDDLSDTSRANCPTQAKCEKLSSA